MTEALWNSLRTALVAALLSVAVGVLLSVVLGAATAAGRRSPGDRDASTRWSCCRSASAR